MPTIPQLPTATQINADDELPLSQAGLTRSVTVGELLSGTQPALSIASGTLLGRVSLGAGGPEPVPAGIGVAISNNSLVANGADHAGFPVHGAMQTGDQAVLNSGGQPALLPLSALQGLYSAGNNVIISGGVISSDVPLATVSTAGAVIPGAGLVLGSGSTITVNYGTAPGTAAQGNDPRIAGAERAANKGQPNGYAALDSSGRLPIAQLTAAVAGGIAYQGVWNAATNSPALASGTGTTGHFYQVGTSGTTALDGINQWNAGDAAVFNGTAWQKISGGFASADLSTSTVLATSSTIERSLATRFADYINVDDFGLARDGVTDDSAKLVVAVNTAIAKTGKLYIPAGGPILMAGAAQATLQSITILGDGLTDIGYPYGHIGSQFWIADTQLSPFLLGTNVTIDGVAFFYPNQIDQPTAPIAYPPLFTSAPSASQVAQLTIKNCQITNAYDVLTIPQSIICGDVVITNNRVCAINTCFTLPNVPEVIYLSNNLFTYGIYQDEYNHWGGGGSQAQTLYTSATTADAAAGSTTLNVANAANVVVGMPVQGSNIAWNAMVTAVSGNAVTISPGTLADVPAGSNITFVQNNYYLKNYTAQNATWLLITGNGTAAAVSTISHGGIIASNNYVFGFRYGIHVNGGNLLIARLTNTGFDEVGTILQCDNFGTVYDLQIDNFLVFGLLATSGTSPPTTLFVISNPPPDATGNPNTRLSISNMTIGFSTGTIFDIAGANVAEVKISDCKLTRYAATASGQPYYALRINAPNSRLLLTGNDVLPASEGNTGIQINAILAATIIGNSFTDVQAAIDVETTGGMIALSGNSSIGTSGGNAIVGIGTSNIQDCGNSWDQRPLNWNPIYPSYMTPALNGLTFKADGGSGVSINTEGPSSDITLNLVTTGGGSIAMLTRGYAQQFVVQDSANTTTMFATGGSAGAPATITVAGSSATGLALQSTAGGPIQLGSAGASGSSVVHLGATVDRSYSVPTGITGGVYQVPNNTSDVQLTTSAGTVASLALSLPAQPADGQVVDISSVAAITTLAVQPGGNSALIGAPSALEANGSIRFKYLGGSINTWFHRAYA